MPVRVIEPAQTVAQAPQSGRVRIIEQGNGPTENRTSQLQGFAKGAYETTRNLAPLMNGFGGNGAMMEEEARAELKGIAAREAAGVKSGRIGRFVGQVATSGPIAMIPKAGLGGAAAGLATSEHEDLAGKAMDAALGAIGGKVGGAVVGKVADTLAPVIRPAVSRLQAAGVKLTPGQIKGGAAMVREDRLMSKPVVGGIIANDREAGLDTFNRAAVDKALEPLGAKLPAGVQSGFDAVDHAHEVVSKAYDKIVPNLKVSVDPRFVAGVRQVYNDTVSGLPQQAQDQFMSALKKIRFGQGGSASGKPLQDALSDLGRLSRQYSTSAVAGERELGRAFGGLRQELDDMLIRQNPGQAQGLKAANKAFRGLAMVEDAASRADGGTFSTGQLKQAVRRGDSSARKSASSRGKAYMQDFSSDAREVLPAVEPNSGTAGRMNQGSIRQNMLGAVDAVGYRADKALTNALAKLPPQARATARKAILLGKNPLAFIGALGASHAASE